MPSWPQSAFKAMTVFGNSKYIWSNVCSQATICSDAFAIYMYIKANGEKQLFYMYNLCINFLENKVEIHSFSVNLHIPSINKINYLYI